MEVPIWQDLFALCSFLEPPGKRNADTKKSEKAKGARLAVIYCRLRGEA